jgi:hypothetical protein
MKNSMSISRRLFIILTGALICAGSIGPSAEANGLSTAFADVQLENVPLGVAYPIASSAGEGLRLQNLGVSPARVHIEVLRPADGDLRGGAEPIPDIHWIKVTPDRLDLPGRGEGRCHLTLLIPKNKMYRHKYYQATIWSHGEPLPGQGVVISAGLLSRLRFKVR